MRNIVQDCPEILEHGTRLVDEYLERNVAQEHYRAMALKVFNVALKQWNCSIMEAYNKAAVCGVSVRTVRRWISDYYFSLVASNPREIEDDDLNTIFSSLRGKNELIV